jgi:aldose 1-epimerase
MPDGRPVRCLVLDASPEVELHLVDLGATVHRIVVTGGDGVRRDVALGHPTVAAYLAAHDYLGASVGRYANRIRGGAFTIDGNPVVITPNDRSNALHGGPEGFDRRIWQILDATPTSALLRLVSPDGDQGFPGELTVDALFEVDQNTISITYQATTDAPTVINLTQHTYFNLGGDAAGSVDGHELTVHAQAIIPVDGTGIPLTERLPVTGTPFDLRRPTRLAGPLRSAHEQVVLSGGIDHNYVLDGSGLRDVAELSCAATATTLTLATDQPGLQVYVGNFLDGPPARHGGRYRQGDGIALEPQLFPDTPNRPDFGSAVLRPGERYRARCVWRFTDLAR